MASNAPQKSSSIRNRLLIALPRKERDRLFPTLEHVDLKSRQVLLKQNAPIDHVYFVQDGMVSLVKRSKKGPVIEVGLVGKEGMVGSLAVLGADAISDEAIVQVPGSAFRMRADVLRKEAARNAATRDLLHRFVQAFFAHVSQSALCNGQHKLEKRAARWLLMGHDRVDGDELRLSHDFLSMMLGVRRAGVTNALTTFKKAKLIETDRGRIFIRNRAGLERASCECYHVVRNEYARLLR